VRAAPALTHNGIASLNNIRQAIIIRDDASRDLGAVCKALEYRYEWMLFAALSLRNRTTRLLMGAPACRGYLARQSKQLVFKENALHSVALWFSRRQASDDL